MILNAESKLFLVEFKSNFTKIDTMRDINA